MNPDVRFVPVALLTSLPLTRVVLEVGVSGFAAKARVWIHVEN